ncbi:uncharacterized protein LOC133350161 isoform X2 [Lethenteron reissneri]|uniref:uncharacterized protein LOC133350161 isoform X2 n=1 Tax=Lethenteron reissneri TaxID=7753 RepID=UPI002AB7817F|nr:uncharacterized protein LOC133350161 isoform X2 [Lethenteron reissneri]
MNLPLRLLILLLSTTTSSSISCTTSTTSTNACNITSSTNGREMKPLPRPQNVTLTGRNFFFKLKWQAPADCENCTYEARWQHYGSNCCNTEDCSPGNVAGATSCNLSISQDMLVDKIIVDVRTTSTQLDSSSAWVQIRCLPRNVVELDAPRVTLFKEGDSLRLAITPPELRHLDGENVVLDTYKAVITAAGEQNHNEEVEFQGSEFTFPVNGSIFWTLSKPRLCVRVHAVVTIGSWEKETGRSTEECVQFSREGRPPAGRGQRQTPGAGIPPRAPGGPALPRARLAPRLRRGGRRLPPQRLRPRRDPRRGPRRLALRGVPCAAASPPSYSSGGSDGRAGEMVAGGGGRRGGRGGETPGEPGPVVGRGPARRLRRRRHTRRGRRRAPAGGRRLLGRRHAAVGGRGGWRQQQQQRQQRAPLQGERRGR